MRRRRGRWETWQLAVTGTVGLAIGAAVGAVLGIPRDESESLVSLGPTTTEAPAGVPAGDDTTVTAIVDGDTIDVTGDTRIRLIGIDTPEATGTTNCYGPEASTRLAQLTPVGQRIRLVYDVERLDSFGRTLAYVYRLPDGEFVNLALAREGYADLLTVGPNVAHSARIQAAVTEAREANRGLWSACRTTTTTVAVSTSVTTPRTTQRPTPTTTTEPPASDDCHPSYSGACVPIASDVDCGGGSGNGPAYVYAKRFEVIGPDEYGLDRDGDGVACET